MMDPIEFKNLTKELVGCEAFDGDGQSMGRIIHCVEREEESSDYKVTVTTDNGHRQHIKASVALYDGETLSFSDYSSWTIVVNDNKDSCRKCRSRCKADKMCGLYDPPAKRN